MTLYELSIRRPVLAIVFSLVLMLFGAVSYFTLGVREYPAVDPPVVTVRADYLGASPAVIASQITEPLEQQINGIDGVRVLSSTSSEEQSRIRVEFQPGADLEAAANDVRDRVARAVRQLPPDADPAVIEKADADSEPILIVERAEPRAQSPRGERLRRPRPERAHPDHLRREPTCASTARSATRCDSGSIRCASPRTASRRSTCRPRSPPRTSICRAGGSRAARSSSRCAPPGACSSPEDFEAMILKEEGGRQVLLRDVGHAELGAEELRSGARAAASPW